MLKWKKFVFSNIADGVESLTDILAGQSGKNRRVKFMVGDIDANIFMRAYRDGEQFVDFDCSHMTTAAPLVPVDIPLVEGQLLKVGFYSVSAGGVTPTIAIGYEED